MNGRNEGNRASGTRAVTCAADVDDDRVRADSFDRWLNEKLVLLYDPVLREPIPEQLMGLIDAHRRGEDA